MDKELRKLPNVQLNLLNLIKQGIESDFVVRLKNTKIKKNKTKEEIVTALKQDPDYKEFLEHLHCKTLKNKACNIKSHDFDVDNIQTKSETKKPIIKSGKYKVVLGFQNTIVNKTISNPVCLPTSTDTYLEKIIMLKKIKSERDH